MYIFGFQVLGFQVHQKKMGYDTSGCSIPHFGLLHCCTAYITVFVGQKTLPGHGIGRFSPQVQQQAILGGEGPRVLVGWLDGTWKHLPCKNAVVHWEMRKMRDWHHQVAVLSWFWWGFDEDSPSGCPVFRKTRRCGAWVIPIYQAFIGHVTLRQTWMAVGNRNPRTR